MPATSTDASGLAGRYAGALFDLARDHDALDAVAADLRNVRALLDESGDLRRLVRSPVISREDQANAVGTVAERAGFHELTRKVLGFLAHQRRLFAVADVALAYERMLAEHKGEVGAEVVTAVPLSSAQQDTIRDQLTSALGRSVTLSTTVDPGLLGGLVVRVGSRMIDASIRTKLRQLELALKGAA